MSEKLKQKIADLIHEANWYFTCSGYQNQHASDLSLEDHFMEDADEVIDAIIEAVRHSTQSRGSKNEN